MKYTQKGLDKRKKDREGLAEFFMQCVARIKKERLTCRECGSKLQGNVSEVAHILPKNYFRSVQTNPLNWLPLCGMYSAKQCHSNFDTYSLEKVKKMQIYKEVVSIFAVLEDFVDEKIPYKIYDKYTEDKK